MLRAFLARPTLPFHLPKFRSEVWLMALMFGGALLPITLILGDHIGAPEVNENAQVIERKYNPKWTSTEYDHISMGNNMPDILIPHQTEHPATWALQIRTRNGDVSITVHEEQGQKLSPGIYVRVNYRIGRLSHSPIALTFVDPSAVTLEEE
jgi:hypothetical protein